MVTRSYRVDRVKNIKNLMGDENVLKNFQNVIVIMISCEQTRVRSQLKSKKIARNNTIGYTTRRVEK